MRILPTLLVFWLTASQMRAKKCTSVIASVAYTQSRQYFVVLQGNTKKCVIMRNSTECLKIIGIV